MADPPLPKRPPASGYSGTPLAEKLGLRPGHVLALVGAPAGWSVERLPDGARARRGLRGRADVVVAFVRRAAELDTVASVVVPKLGPNDALWVAWPRRAGGHVSDVTDTVVRSAFLPGGLVDVKVAALDDDWSGLRFVWRRERRARAGST
ncbi:MAG TPA: DUF3052 domain-containing protein [Acidimicrobiales bacterium]|nr:DUF3052 domain-containing protein [Acidimicrobiales bacterium]